RQPSYVASTPHSGYITQTGALEAALEEGRTPYISRDADEQTPAQTIRRTHLPRRTTRQTLPQQQLRMVRTQTRTTRTRSNTRTKRETRQSNNQTQPHAVTQTASPCCHDRSTHRRVRG